MSDGRYATLTTARYATHQEPEEQGSRRFPAVHPFLLAAGPALALYAQSPATVMAWEVLAAAGVSLATALALYLVLRIFYRSWNAAALGASWIVLLTFAFGLILRLDGLGTAQGMSFALSRSLLLPAWATTLIVGLWWIGRPRVDVATLTLCAHVFGAFAIGAPLVMVGSDLSTVQASLATAAEQEELSPEEQITLHKPKQPRDIYYLVVSGYADYQTLKHFYQFDNREFLTRLHRRGFHIVADSHANYPRADLTMAAALNMKLLGAGVPSKQRTCEMLENHRVGRLLTKQGYRYFHLGAPVDGLRYSPLAEMNYEFSSLPTNYTDQLISLTAINDWVGAVAPRRQFDEKLQRLESLAQQQGPKFVFAYFSLPQRPWRFDQSGRQPSSNELRMRGDRINYLQQLEYLNTRLEKTINNLLDKSEQTPIIVVQSDEGPMLDVKLDESLGPLDQVQKRTRILNAVLLPERDAAKVVPPNFSPINTFRLIFREYFDGELPLIEDHVFYAHPSDKSGRPTSRRKCQLVDVSGEL